jgi:hypothetical protein
MTNITADASTDRPPTDPNDGRPKVIASNAA